MLSGLEGVWGIGGSWLCSFYAASVHSPHLSFTLGKAWWISNLILEGSTSHPDLMSCQIAKIPVLFSYCPGYKLIRTGHAGSGGGALRSALREHGAPWFSVWSGIADRMVGWPQKDQASKPSSATSSSALLARAFTFFLCFMSLLWNGDDTILPRACED